MSSVLLTQASAVIVFAIWVTPLLVAKAAFDSLCDRLFVLVPALWESLGRPIGGRATRAHASFWRSGFASSSAFNSWLFSAPSVLTSDPYSRVLLSRLRVCAAFFVLLHLVLMAMVVYWLRTVTS